MPNDISSNPTTWKRKDVIAYLNLKREELDLDEKYIKIFEKNEVTGLGLLVLTYDDLVNKHGEFQLSFGTAKIIINLIEELNTQKKKKPLHKYTLKDLASLIQQKYGITCNEATVVKEIPEFIPGFVDVKNNEIFKRCLAEIKV